MAASNTDVMSAKQAEPPIEVPSLWWRRWQAFKGTNPQHLTIPEVDLSNKWVLLAGGNSGIGFEAALQFAKWGANIVLGCRPNPPSHEMHPDEAVKILKDAASAAGHHTAIEWWECDMSSLKSVEAFGQRWLETGRPLDILANNAGIAPKESTDGKAVLTIDGFEIVHQVSTPPPHQYDFVSQLPG